ncbi:kinesin-like protein KIN-4C, partial [Tanacetum coccineum]
MQHKTEEASMATKRLKDVLESRKTSRETYGSSSSPRVQALLKAIEHELDVTVRVHVVCCEFERQKEERLKMAKEVAELKDEANLSKQSPIRWDTILPQVAQLKLPRKIREDLYEQSVSSHLMNLHLFLGSRRGYGIKCRSSKQQAMAKTKSFLGDTIKINTTLLMLNDELQQARSLVAKADEGAITARLRRNIQCVDGLAVFCLDALLTRLGLVIVDGGLGCRRLRWRRLIAHSQRGDRGLKGWESGSEINKAYDKAALKHHPDKVEFFNT